MGEKIFDLESTLTEEEIFLWYVFTKVADKKHWARKFTFSTSVDGKPTTELPYKISMHEAKRAFDSLLDEK